MANKVINVNSIKLGEDWNEHKDEFALLLEVARGPYTITNFSDKCNLSPAYISRLIRGLVKTAPLPHILINIANASENRVSYEALLNAARIEITGTVTLKNYDMLLLELEAVETKCQEIRTLLKNDIDRLSCSDLNYMIKTVKDYSGDLRIIIEDNLGLSDRF